MISIAKSLFIKKGEYLQVRLFVSFFDRLVFGPHMTRIPLCLSFIFYRWNDINSFNNLFTTFKLDYLES